MVMALLKSRILIIILVFLITLDLVKSMIVNRVPLQNLKTKSQFSLAFFLKKRRSSNPKGFHKLIQIQTILSLDPNQKLPRSLNLKLKSLLNPKPSTSNQKNLLTTTPWMISKLSVNIL